jgi:uncharacterized protein YegP (UPF0339 family)
MTMNRRRMAGLALVAAAGGAFLSTDAAQAAATMTFEVYKDAKGEFRWRLKATNGQIIATGGQGYSAKADCKHAIESIQKHAAAATIEDMTAKA